MCGIAGYFGRERIEQSRLDKCFDAMNRRGPDDSGLYKSETNRQCLYLLHSRLSIIDLDPRAKQPFSRQSQVLIYNGELYNYKELAASHLQNHSFSTKSDTEVLFELLNNYGPEILKQCEGMWAFASFDRDRNLLTLSRDRFGEKPLYVYEDHKGIYFASEPKMIFALMGKKLPVNLRKLEQYLVNGYKSLFKRSETFYEGLLSLEPGSCRVIAEGNRQTFRYWNPNYESIDNSLSYADSVSLVREDLERSVSLRLRSDVPIAFCFSGGVDSNALAAIATSRLHYPVHAYSIINTDERYDELEHINAAVRELGLSHTKIPISRKDFLPNLRDLVNYHDSPISTITYYAHSQLLKAISSDGFKVSVSGTGADEIFSGYYDHHNAYLKDMHDQDPELYLHSLSQWQAHISPIVRNRYLKDPSYFIDQPSARQHIYLDASYFASFLKNKVDTNFYEETYTRASLLRNRMANELYKETVPVLLHEDDLNSMFYSVENRSPFLDSNLVNTLNRIPTKHLFRDGYAKSLLRDAVRDCAPELIVNNHKKTGFNVPLEDYLDLQDKDIVNELLSDSPIFDIVERDKIRAELKNTNFPNSRSKFLFNFVCAKIFLESCA